MAGRDAWNEGEVMIETLRLWAALACVAALSGCAVVSVASTAVSVGAGAVGLAADAVIGTARITGKAVGAAADAVLPDDDTPKD
jgi:hypothetical protein